jgi:diamine N-acetyltransferase
MRFVSGIELQPVTAANWRACAALSVRADQVRFVAPVTYYLCLCAYGDTWQPMAVVRDGTVVGFCMYGIDDDDGYAWIGGLVIDQSQQRTGVARAAVSALIDRFVGEPERPGIALSYAPDNIAARALYRSLGFIETGETEDDGAELVARRTFDHRGLS